MPRRKLTEKDISTILSAIASGEKPPALAVKYGVTPQHIRLLTRRHSLSTQPYPPTAKPEPRELISAELRAKIFKEFNVSSPPWPNLPLIAEKYGVSHTCAYACMKGLPFTEEEARPRYLKTMRREMLHCRQCNGEVWYESERHYKLQSFCCPECFSAFVRSPTVGHTVCAQTGNGLASPLDTNEGRMNACFRNAEFFPSVAFPLLPVAKSYLAELKKRGKFTPEWGACPVFEDRPPDIAALLAEFL